MCLILQDMHEIIELTRERERENSALSSFSSPINGWLAGREGLILSAGNSTCICICIDGRTITRDETKFSRWLVINLEN